VRFITVYWQFDRGLLFGPPCEWRNIDMVTILTYMHTIQLPIWLGISGCI